MDTPETWTFVVGQHESDRRVPVSPDLIQRAHDSNYHIVTTPITTPSFHSKLLTLLSSHLSNVERPVHDACGTLGTSQNTKPLTVPPLSLSDSHLSPNSSLSSVVAITSKWIDLCSPDPLIADISRQILIHEVAYAAFCGVSYVIIPGPKLHHGGLHGEGLMYYARAIQEILTVAPYIHVHIWLHMTDNPSADDTDIGHLAPFARKEYLGQQGASVSAKPDELGTWDAWDVIRRVCKYHARLFVALTLPKYLPSSPVQSRWLSEPVHILSIDANTFLKNQKGYPVLSKAHQGLISRFMRLKTQPWIILCDVGPIPEAIDETDASPTPAEAVQRHAPKKGHDSTPHLSYIRNLQTKQPTRTPMERFGVGYQDFLQAPLQPLTVNLESVTYEVFEKDPIKYEWYERAIAKALKDWVAHKRTTSSPDGRVVVAVVGAGRGPLVTRAIRASVEADVDIEMWAVEKNQNAFVHLQRQNTAAWAGSVNLVHSDMRSWKGPCRLPSEETEHSSTPTHYAVDILISELLGSFGDNELSPECLDGVTHLLNPRHGISIPASYSAHLTPISSPRLYADITAQTFSNPTAPETPYVVMLHAFDFLSTNQPAPGIASPRVPPSEVSSPSSSRIGKLSTPTLPTLETATPIVHTAWTFSHPNTNIPPPSKSSSVLSNAHNVRQTRLTFPCRERGVCHGLGGYFETVLYDDVELSTNPVTMDAKSEGMISWFPIYFPLKTPLHVPENSEVVVTMYRQTDDRKVWYEWIVEVFELRDATGSIISPFTGNMNGNGMRRHRVAMSEFHSSIKEGCLM